MKYCIWCNREFKKSSLFYSFYSSSLLFNDNFECTFCNPSFPITIKPSMDVSNDINVPSDSNDIITIFNIGSYLDLNHLNHSKYLYPVDYCISRKCKSYLFKSYTNVKCEILSVDENYFQKPYIAGKKDVLLFRATFDDDINNPLEVIDDLYHMAPLLKQRYRTQSPSTHHLFGFDNLYIQYLIRIHVENADQFEPFADDLLALLNCNLFN